MCGVKIEEGLQEELKKVGVRDSKLLTPRRRELLAKLILEQASGVEVIEVSAAEIDNCRLVEKVNLNEMEAMHFARIIDKLNPELAYLDSPDPNPKLFETRILRYLKSRPRIVAENFADSKYVAVSAASVVAKVRRDQRIAELRGRHGNLGSGYPSDPVTISFLEKWVREHGKLPEFARRSWATAQRIEAQAKQRRII
jgi:ribonuclease HII